MLVRRVPDPPGQPGGWTSGDIVDGMTQPPITPPPSPPVGPAPPPLPPGHGEIMVRPLPHPESRWLRIFYPAPDFRVDRKRWRATYPVTFLTAPAGLRRLQLREAGGRGRFVSIKARVEVYPGQWRRLTVGPWQGRTYPTLVDERGVNINTATPPGCKQVILALLGFLILVAGFAAACWFGSDLRNPL